MAGMGEACSHIGGFLFLIEAGTNFKNGTTCTDKRNSWLQPYQKEVEYLKIKDIDFQSASAKYKRALNPKAPIAPKRKSSAIEPTDEEMHNFLSNLHDNNLSSAILTVVEPFSNNFITDVTIKKLTNLFSSQNTKLPWKELLGKCRDVEHKLCITKCESEKIELETRKQSKSKKWFDFRTGRITSSNMKAVCRTEVDAPSVSVIKKICYPFAHNFSTAATEWGKQHEKEARLKYTAELEKRHKNFSITENGLIINPDFPFIGATPDGLTKCDCCDNGVVEIKCPYVNRDKTITEMISEKNCCIAIDEIGNITLDKNHEYYYQIQTHLLTTNANFCDFFVWTKKDFHLERIYPDEMLQETIAEKAHLFFNFCVLPELLAKWFCK